MEMSGRARSVFLHQSSLVRDVVEGHVENVPEEHVRVPRRAAVRGKSIGLLLVPCSLLAAVAAATPWQLVP